jgi:hypothetical protein
MGAVSPSWSPQDGQNRLGWPATKPQREHCTVTSVVWTVSNERKAVTT